MKDLAITTTGVEAWVTGFEWRGSRYRSDWTPVTLRVDAPPGEFTTEAKPQPEPDRSHPWSTSKRVLPWSQRLRAVGQILDQAPPTPKDLVLIEVGDGFVAQGQMFTRDQEDPWLLVTREIDEATILRTCRNLQPVNRIQLMRLRPLATT